MQALGPAEQWRLLQQRPSWMSTNTTEVLTPQGEPSSAIRETLVDFSWVGRKETNNTTGNVWLDSSAASANLAHISKQENLHSFMNSTFTV